MLSDSQFKEKLLREHTWEEVMNTDYAFNFFLDKPEEDMLYNSNLPLRSFFKKFTAFEKRNLQNWSVDTENLLQQDLPLQEYNEDFGYDLNKYGFRCNQFDSTDNPRIIVYGCSITYGTGLPESHTWPSMVKELLKISSGQEYDLLNFAVPGTGFNEIHRLINFLPDFAKSNSMVFVLMPPGIRKQYILKHEDTIRNIQFSSNNSSTLSKILKIISSSSIEYDKSLVIKTIQSMCNSLKIPVKIMDFDNDFNLQYPATDANWLHKDTKKMLETQQIPLTHRARDLIHHGTIKQIDIAQKMLELK
jgi:hypothetical protein